MGEVIYWLKIWGIVMMQKPDIMGELLQLLKQWDELVNEAASKGDAMTAPNHATYYYGTMFGLEKAREELSALLASIWHSRFTRHLKIIKYASCFQQGLDGYTLSTSTM